MNSVVKQIMAHATSAYQAGKYSEASHYLRDLVENEPENWRCQLLFGLCLVRLGDLGAAMHTLTFIADHCPIDIHREEAMAQLHEVIYAQEMGETLSKNPVLDYARIDANFQNSMNAQ